MLRRRKPPWEWLDEGKIGAWLSIYVTGSEFALKSKVTHSDLDWKEVSILKALCRNGRLSFAELGRLVGPSG